MASTVPAAHSTDLHDMRAGDPVLNAMASHIQQAAAEDAAQISETNLGGVLPRRVLITGSAGYLGATLMRTLQKRGIATVGVDIRSSETTDLVGAVEEQEFLLRAAADCQAILHTAALHAPHDSSHTEADFARVNIAGTASVLAAAQASGASVVYSSTTSLTVTPRVQESAKRGQCVWLDETSVPAGAALAVEDAPRNKYGRTKSAAEGLCMAAAKNGLAVLVLRVGRFFPEDVLDRDTSKPRLANIKANELLHRRLALVDTVDAHLRALARAPVVRTGTFTLAAPFPWPRSATPTEATAVAALVRRERPEAARIFEARGWSLDAQISRITDCTAAQEVLGWRPQWTFDTLLARLARDDSAAQDALLGLY